MPKIPLAKLDEHVDPAAPDGIVAIMINSVYVYWFPWTQFPA